MELQQNEHGECNGKLGPEGTLVQEEHDSLGEHYQKLVPEGKPEDITAMSLEQKQDRHGEHHQELALEGKEGRNGHGGSEQPREEENQEPLSIQPLPPPSSSSSPSFMANTLDDANRLFESGRAALRDDDYDQAIDCFSRALEIRARHYGELAPECAPTYYEYGCALLYKVQAETDALNEPGSVKQKEQDADEADGEEDEDRGEENLEDEEESDLDDAWKMLDIARAILEKQQSHSILEVDVITALADVSLEREDFEMCFRDYTRALEILEGLVEPDNRQIAEVCFKLSLAQQLGYKPKDALKFCQRAVSVCEARLQRLKSELSVGNKTCIGKEKQVDDKIKETQQESVTKEGSPGASQGIQTPTNDNKEGEVAEYERLLEDLRDKVTELEQMASGPSILEAFEKANPVAVDAIKQVLSASTNIVAKEVQTVSSSCVGSSSSVFDTPSHSNASTTITDLGVVGRGVKRACPVAVNTVTNSSESLVKRRTLDDMITGGSVGNTQIGFSPAVGSSFGHTSNSNGRDVSNTQIGFDSSMGSSFEHTSNCNGDSCLKRPAS